MVVYCGAEAIACRQDLRPNGVATAARREDGPEASEGAKPLALGGPEGIAKNRQERQNQRQNQRLEQKREPEHQRTGPVGPNEGLTEMSEFSLKVMRRDGFGKNENRRLRATGSVPAVVYGGDQDNVAISVNDHEMQGHLRKGGANSLFLLQLDGTEEKRHVMIRDLQVDPRNGALIHIDFYRVVMDEVVRVSVPIELEGTPIGVRRDNGLVDFVTREVEVECLPTVIPSSITLDITDLELGHHIEASDLVLDEGIQLADDETRVIVSVSVRKLEEEEPEEEEGLETDEPEAAEEEEGDGED